MAAMTAAENYAKQSEDDDESEHEGIMLVRFDTPEQEAFVWQMLIEDSERQYTPSAAIYNFYVKQKELRRSQPNNPM